MIRNRPHRDTPVDPFLRPALYAARLPLIRFPDLRTEES